MIEMKLMVREIPVLWREREGLGCFKVEVTVRGGVITFSDNITKIVRISPDEAIGFIQKIKEAIKLTTE